MASYTIITQAGFTCPYCDKSATLLDERGLAYNLRPLGRTALLEAAEKANMNTVPIIYHGVRKIGGYEDLLRHLSD